MLLLSGVVLAHSQEAKNVPLLEPRIQEPTFQEYWAQVKIPKISFRESTVDEALDFLVQRSGDFSPEGAKLNVIFKRSGAAEKPRVTLELKNVPVTEVVQSISSLSNSTVRWDNYALLIVEPFPGKPAAAIPPARPALKVAGGVEVEKLSRSLLMARISKVNFVNSTLRDACEFILRRHKQLDPEEEAFEFGFDITEEKTLPSITFAAANLPTRELLLYVAELTDLEVSAEVGRVTFSRKKK